MKALLFAALCCLFTFTIQAQKPGRTMPLIGTDPAVNTYTGPRFAGGSDSLQATLQRATRSASAPLAGQVFLCLRLDAVGTVQESYLLPPPLGTPDAALSRSKEAKKVEVDLASRLHQSWQPGPGAPGQNKATVNTIILPLTFGSTTVALPYSEENPVFPATEKERYPGVISFLQRLIRYPANDVRNNVQGTVYVYFEVTETGAVEQRRVVGSVSPTLDAESLRVLNLLPNAMTPPRQAGRPVRVSYVLPLNYRIM